MAFRLPQKAIVKASGLLPMLYKPSELAEHLCINRRTLYDWIDKKEVPHTRDAYNRIWINGQDFAQWVVRQKRTHRKKLRENEAYCMRCKKNVRLKNPKIISIKAKLINIRGKCPSCDGKIVRGGRKND